MGRNDDMGLSLKGIFASLRKPRRVKSDRKIMSVREDDFLSAQQNPEVKKFLADTRAEEQRLESANLIHP